MARLETRKRHANKLSYNKRLSIVTYVKKYPEKPLTDVAKELNVTYAQARHSMQLHKEGKLGKPSTKEKKRKQLAFDEARQKLDTMPDQSLLKETLTGILKDVIATLQTDPDLSPKEMVEMSDRVARTLKTLLESDVAFNVRNPDAQIVIYMLQQVKPTITEKEIIELFHTAKRAVSGTRKAGKKR